MFSISNSTTDFFVVKRAFTPAQNRRQLRRQTFAALMPQFLRHAVERLSNAASNGGESVAVAAVGHRRAQRAFKICAFQKCNNSRFEKLSADYENEQTELTEKMQLLEQEIAQQEEEADSIEQFILRAKKYPNLQELTPAVLHDLVNRVYVSAPDKSSGQRVQDVHISLACIGFLPESIIAEMLTHASKSRTA